MRAEPGTASLSEFFFGKGLRIVRKVKGSKRNTPKNKQTNKIRSMAVERGKDLNE